MITITTEAAEKIKEILEIEKMSHAGFRISVSGGGCCGPQFEISIDDTSGDSDQIIEKNGAKVYLDTDAAKKLDGAEVGFINDERGQGFVLSFPGRASTGGCGCGEGSGSAGGCDPHSGSGGGCGCK